MTTLTLALPSKGRLQADTIGWFQKRGIVIERTGDTRTYAADAGLEGLEIVLLAAGEIPGALAAGRIHMGVTGEDLINEVIPDHDRRIRIATRLGFGHADLIIAVPACWIDVERMADLDEAARDFRAHHGVAMRVATKYHRLASQFFRQNGFADYRLVDSLGATEAAPKNLTAELIVDITSTGETLRANHLRPLDDGLILASQACLCVSHDASWDTVTSRALAVLEDKLGLS